MASQAAVKLKLEQLKETIQTERVQVSEHISDLSQKVDALKTQIASMPEVDLSTEMAAIEEAIAEVQGILPDASTDPVAEVIETLPAE